MSSSEGVNDGHDDLKLRRQKHREAMRLHRQRHALKLSAMRATLETLSQQFQQLDQLAAGSPQLIKDYRELAIASQRLQKEQLKLQDCVAEWDKLKERMTLLLADHAPVIPYVPIPTRQVQDTSPAVQFTFQELSDAGMQQVIRRCSVNLQLCQARSVQVFQPSATLDSNFGWSIGWDLSNENDVMVFMTKRWSGISAHQVMLRTWDTADNPALYSHLAPINHELVQVVPHRAFVKVRDISTHGQVQGRAMRSCMMCFNVKTERGYAVGTGCVAPEQCPTGGKKVEYVEFYNWTEFVDDIDGSCIATVSYRGQYNSGDTPHRRFLNLFSAVRKWEDFVLAQPLQLLD